MRELLKKSFKEYLEGLIYGLSEDDWDVSCCARIILENTTLENDFIDLHVAEAFTKQGIDIDNPKFTLVEENLDSFWEESFFVPVINRWVRDPLQSIGMLVDTLS